MTLIEINASIYLKLLTKLRSCSGLGNDGKRVLRSIKNPSKGLKAL